MFSWFVKKAETLKPLPLSQREKSYSAASGIVYQYIFKGMLGKRHVFSVSADRNTHFEVTVEMTENALASCAARMGSPLRWNEEYALAKLSLFNAFDEAIRPDDLANPVRPGSEDLLSHMDTLKMT
jgi:hypothetical protein